MNKGLKGSLKRWKTVVVLSAFLLASIVDSRQALAKEEMTEHVETSVPVSLENVLWPDEAGKYSYTYKDAQPGSEYVLLIVSGICQRTEEITQEKLSDSLLYIDQKAAGEGGVTFDGFVPSRTDNGTVLVAGEGEPASVIGYLSKDLFTAGAYTMDEKGTKMLEASMTAFKGTVWEDFKKALPTECYVEIRSDYVTSVYVPVRLAWGDCTAYDSTKPGETFDLTADVILKDGYASGRLADALGRMLKPLKASVTIQEVAAVPVRMTAVKGQAVYQEGETISTDDITVQITYSDGSVREVSGWISDADSLPTAKAGIYDLTVTYTEKDVTLQVQIAITIIPKEEQKEDKKLYQVNFDAGYGQEIAPVHVAAGETVPKPDTVLDRKGYVFLGWYFDNELWDFEQNTVENDMTLCAKWFRKYGDGTDFYCYGEEEPVCVYTGKALKPSFVLMDKNLCVLTPKKDYTIKYINNVQVSEGKAKAVITGKGNYDGTLEIPFTITEKDLADESAVKMKCKPYSAYKKNGCRPTLSAKYNGKSLKAETDFSVSYQKIDSYDSESGTPVQGSVLQEAGLYRVIVEGTGNFTGQRRFTFQVGAEGLKDLKKASVTFPASANLPCTGKDAELDGVVLKLENAELKEGTDYILELPDDNKNAGKKTAVARALPGSTLCYGEKEIKYTITGLPMKAVKVNLKNRKINYTGTPVMDNIESVTIRLDEKKAGILRAYYGEEFSGGDTWTLRKNTDYTVQYIDSIKAGKAVIRLTGKGVFTGTLESKFTIGKTNLNGGGVEVMLEKASVPQKKSGAAPAVQAVYTEGGQRVVLEEGRDYTLRYSGNKRAGTNAKVTVKGIGNYTGSLTKTFTIEPKPLDAPDVKIAAVHPVKQKKKAGYIYRPKILAYDGDTPLKEGTDFTVNYSGCLTQADVESGRTEGQVVITEKSGGSYSGSFTVLYQVAPNSIEGKACTITISDQIYTGTPVTFDLKKEEDRAAFMASITREDGQTVALIPGQDFEVVSYSKNTACGTAKMVLRGIGTYGGSRTVKFKIVRQRIQ